MRRLSHPLVLTIVATSLATTGLLLLLRTSTTTIAGTANMIPARPSTTSTITTTSSSISPTPRPSTPTTPPSSAPSSATSTAPAPSSSSTSWDEVGPPGQPAPVGGIPATPAGTLEQQRAVEAAYTFMAAFARPAPGTDPGTWWSAVAPLMTPQGRLDYQGVDPTRVPFTRPTGPGLIQPQPADADQHLETLVRIPTDAGDYLVTLQQRDTSWLIARITPPRAAPA